MEGPELDRETVTAGLLVIESRVAFQRATCGVTRAAGSRSRATAVELGEVLSGSHPGRTSDDRSRSTSRWATRSRTPPRGAGARARQDTKLTARIGCHSACSGAGGSLRGQAATADPDAELLGGAELRPARLAVDRERRAEARRAARARGAASRRRTGGHAAGSSASTPRSSAARTRSRGRTRPSRRASCAAPRAASPRPCPRASATDSQTESLEFGARWRSPREAEPVGSLQEVKEAGLDREDLLGIYRNMLITRGDRGARAHPLQAGQDPGLVLHGPRQRGRRGRRRDGDGPRRRRHAAPPRHGRARHARRRAVADLRAVHGPRRRARRRAGTATSTWPTRGSG